MSLSKYTITVSLIFYHLFGLLSAQKFNIVEKKLSSEIKIINDLKFNHNTLWVASGNGLFGIENGILKPYAKNKEKNNLKINSIEIDSLGNKWLGTYNGELIKFNNDEILSVIKFDKYLKDENPIITDISISVQEHKILLSTASGKILYYDFLNTAQGTIKSPVNTIIYSISYGNNKNIWLCSADGFFIKHANGKWKRKQGIYLAYGIFNQAGNYWAIGRNQDKKALFMLYYKRENLSGNKYVWKEFKLDKLSNQYARFYELSIVGEYAWITSDIGLIKYDVLSGKLTLIDKYQNIDLKKIRHIARQDNNTLWISTAGNKLYKLEIKK
jgi:ligand-binding sensor domain-containing protein